MKGFRLERWRQVCKQIVYRAVLAKFQQNTTLQQLLLDSGNKLLVESSMDSYWGTGIHLHNKAALDRKFWKNEGGVMSDILSRVREDKVYPSPPILNDSDNYNHASFFPREWNSILYFVLHLCYLYQCLCYCCCSNFLLRAICLWMP